jgi:hypothetical protein
MSLRLLVLVALTLLLTFRLCDAGLDVSEEQQALAEKMEMLKQYLLMGSSGGGVDDMCRKSVGQTLFDLSDLRSDKDYVGIDPTDQTYIYSMNPCGVSNINSHCKDIGGAICQFAASSGNPYVATIASWQSVNGGTWTYIDPNNPGKGVAVSFMNGDPQCNIGGTVFPRDTIINFVCTPGAGVGSTFAVTENAQGQCLFTINFATEVSCPNYVTTARKAADAEQLQRPLSNGWIFNVVWLMSVLIYFVGGWWYKSRYTGLSGAEAIPNVDFWRDLPSLVSDGCRYSWEKTMRAPCCQRGSADTTADYANL